MKDLSGFLRENGFEVDFPCNGEFFRFDRGGTLNGWFVGRTYTIGEKTITVARFGDWRTGEKYKFETSGQFSPEEKAEIARHVKESEASEKEARERQQVEVAELSEARWRLAKEFRSNPYLGKKGLPGQSFGCRGEGENLLVPVRDIEGKLWGIQKIQPDGGKYFTPGQKIKGCFHVIGELPDGYSGSIGITEGVATAASLFLGCGFPIVSSFNAGNLTAVAEAIRARFPQARCLVFADNDLWTKRPNGQAWNPGREFGLAAARACQGTLVLPVFKSLDSRPTDFNDLHCLEGLSVVKEQIEGLLQWGELCAKCGIPRTGIGHDLSKDPFECLNPPRGGGTEIRVVDAGCGDFSTEEWADDLEPLPWTVNPKTGNSKPPSHQACVDHLLGWYGGRLICQEENLFRYTGTHWRLLDTAENNEIMRQLQHVIGGVATYTQLVTMKNLLTTYCPHTPYDIFIPRYTCANFLNGTLHLVRGEDYKFKKEFRPHNPDDFLLNVIPLEYAPEKAEKNEEFENMLSRVFQGDPDFEQKIRAVKQMYGAMICPVSPHLFLLHGPAGSGKSSLIIPAMRLVHRDNLCSVQPHEFKGFNMESMAGKLVNFRTDIKLTEAIDDDTVKMIEDRVIIRMDRKFKTPIHAPLPPIHIFGANGVPPTKDGSSGAHDRRWTFIRLDKHKTVPGEYMHDFGNWVFERSPGGVLNFALAGLDDLIANGGHFTTPDSGKVAMAEWQLENDPIGQFLADAKGGEVDQNTRFLFNDEARIRTVSLWEAFRKWVESSGGNYRWMTRFKFYAALRSRGYRTVTVRGLEHFAGIGVVEGGESRF